MQDTPLTDKIWFTGHGKPRTFSEIVNHIDAEIIIGTDSHRRSGRKYGMATAICLDPDILGRRYFWSRRVIPKRAMPSLHERMLAEVQQSLDVANAIVENSKILIPVDITIHVDCSHENARHGSGKSAVMLRNYVQACGFRAVLKPDPEICDKLRLDNPWAASGVADRHAR